MESGGKARELICDLSAGKFKVASDGSLTVKDVKLLASGTWTDSSWGTPLFYPEEVLKEYAGNWFDSPLWCRHGGGVPRSITDKIGEVVEPRYHDAAVHGDLVLHGKTQVSRDAVEMIIAGLADAVSVEHGGREMWDPDRESFISEEIIFYGVALVNRGACDVCTINNSRSTAVADDMKEIQELVEKLSVAEGLIKDLSDASVAKEERLSELEGRLADVGGLDAELAKIAELEARLGVIDAELAKIVEFEARLGVIEKTPVPGVTLAGGVSELGEISLDPIRRDSEGITRRMF